MKRRPNWDCHPNNLILGPTKTLEGHKMLQNIYFLRFLNFFLSDCNDKILKCAYQIYKYIYQCYGIVYMVNTNVTCKARFARGEREAKGMGRWDGEHQRVKMGCHTQLSHCGVQMDTPRPHKGKKTV